MKMLRLCGLIKECCSFLGIHTQDVAINYTCQTDTLLGQHSLKSIVSNYLPTYAGQTLLIID
jgi:hypothetical protein